MRMKRRGAPSALAIPISRVRSVTDTSMMFMMPTPPTSSEMLTTAEITERVMARTPPSYEPDAVVSGATRLPNGAGVVLRVLGWESGPVRERMRGFWDVVRQETLGVGVPRAFLWE